MAKLSAVDTAAARILGNMTFTKGVLAINGASAATVKTTNAIVYSVDGVIYSKAALSAQALTVVSGGTPFYVQPANTTTYYLLAVNAAGTVITVQGDNTARVSSNGPAATFGLGNVPDAPSGYTPFGLIKVATGAVTFTPATTALDAASITFTFYDLSTAPLADKP